MTRFARIILAMSAVLWGSAALAQTTIKGSPHDLSSTGVGITAPAGQAQNQICVYCHFPHNASSLVPLWNRTNSTVAFTMYSAANSATFVLDAGDTNTAARAVGAESLACLSCHDGQTAFKSLNQTPMYDSDKGVLASSYTFTLAGTTTAVTNMSGVQATGTPLSPNLGTSLTDDHPISFTFDTALVTLKGGAANPGGLKDPTVAGGADFGNTLVIYRGGTTNKTIQAQMLFTEGTKVNQLECASCHEPHTHGVSSSLTSNFPFLIKSNQASNLCFTCHNK